jgi:hypothetical protein
MSLRKYSRKCIKKYIDFFGLVLKHRYDDNDDEIGEINIYMKKDKSSSRFNKDNLIKFSHLRYNIGENEKNQSELNINIIKKYKIFQDGVEFMPKLTIELTKILLLYLLALHDEEVDIVSLTASPYDAEKIGEEFCLSCFYQKLGFEPVNFESKQMIKECLKDIDKIKGKEKMCVLCRCNKSKLDFDKNIAPHLDVRKLQIDMVALIPKLKKMLVEANHKISQYC